MNIFQTYKKSFDTIAQNPAVTLFLVLFLIVSNVFMGYMFSARTKVVALILTFCLFLFSLCFTSGWLNIVADVTKDPKGENKNYLAIFFDGIGKNIISVGIASFIYTLILTIVLFLTGKLAYILFGNLDFILNDFATLTQNNNALMEYYNKLPIEQQFIITGWNLSFILSSMIYNFLMLFYFPALIFSENKNVFLKPLTALGNSFCFLFKNFFQALFLYICIYGVYAFLSIINASFGSNPLIAILVLFFYIYFISCSVMLIFNYYEQKNNCPNGGNCIRENENINQSGESN